MTTTLTRVLINPQRRQARKLLTNPQAMHAAVRATFPPDIEQEDARVLWRVDHRGHEHVLYVVGPERPDATGLVEQAGWATRPAQTAEYTRFLAALKKGQRWHFELVANPVMSKAGERGTRGKVVPHVTPEQQLDWLIKKSVNAGFSVAGSGEDGEGLPTARVVERANLRFRRRDRTVTVRTARFDGVLEVTDADALRSTLVHGLGKAKAYGCGLLTLAQPH